MVVESDGDGERARHPEKKRTPSLAELLLVIPRGGEDFKRLRLTPRPVEFEDT